MIRKVDTLGTFQIEGPVLWRKCPKLFSGANPRYPRWLWRDTP